MTAFVVYPRCLLFSYINSRAGLVALQKTCVYPKVSCVALQAQFLFAGAQLLVSMQDKIKPLEALTPFQRQVWVCQFHIFFSFLKPTFSFFINIITNSQFWEIRCYSGKCAWLKPYCSVSCIVLHYYLSSQ
jgi:hypothetical protein